MPAIDDDHVFIGQRVTTGQVDLEQSRARHQAATKPLTNPYLPTPGFRGSFTLHDHQTRKTVVINLWETEAQLQATAAILQDSLQDLIAAGVLVSTPTVEVFEVIGKTDPPQ